MATAIAPRKPIDRGEVESWSKFRIRERIATVRWFFHAKPWILWAVAGSVATLTLEHYDVTFPAIGAFFAGLWSLLVASATVVAGLFGHSL